jgi:hypothetical protein
MSAFVSRRSPRLRPLLLILLYALLALFLIGIGIVLPMHAWRHWQHYP